MKRISLVISVAALIVLLAYVYGVKGTINPLTIYKESIASQLPEHLRKGLKVVPAKLTFDI